MPVRMRRKLVSSANQEGTRLSLDPQSAPFVAKVAIPSRRLPTGGSCGKVPDPMRVVVVTSMLK